MPDLHILENDLEAFSQKLSDLSATINNIASLPYNLSYVKLAMEGGSAPTQATYTGEHMEDQLLALKTSFSTLADNVQASATEYWATEDINQQSIQQVMASVPEPSAPRRESEPWRSRGQTFSTGKADLSSPSQRTCSKRTKSCARPTRTARTP